MRLYRHRRSPGIVYTYFTNVFSIATIHKVCMFGPLSRIVYLCPGALSAAVNRCQTQSVKKLLKMGADPDEMSDCGRSVILVSHRLCGPDITLALMRAGADTQPLFGSYHDVHYLCNSNSSISTHIIYGACQGIQSQIKKEDASLALVAAATNGNAQLCEILIKNGADVTAHSGSALRIARQYKHHLITNLILSEMDTQ